MVVQFISVVIEVMTGLIRSDNLRECRQEWSVFSIECFPYENCLECCSHAVLFVDAASTTLVVSIFARLCNLGKQPQLDMA